MAKSSQISQTRTHALISTRSVLMIFFKLFRFFAFEPPQSNGRRIHIHASSPLRYKLARGRRGARKKSMVRGYPEVSDCNSAGAIMTRKKAWFLIHDLIGTLTCTLHLEQIHPMDQETDTLISTNAQLYVESYYTITLRAAPSHHADSQMRSDATGETCSSRTSDFALTCTRMPCTCL